MEKLKQQLALAHALIEDKEKYVDYYWQFYRMWPFTTINMKAYLKPFHLENKNCFTVQGSSDHIFELFLKSPKKIIGIDTNPLTKYYYDLKLASFAVLDHPEKFLKFFRWNDYPRFCKKNYDVFDKDIFQEISNYLVGDSKIFWEDLFATYEPVKIRKNLFNQVDETNNQALYQSLNYLSIENYEYIRNNRDKINFCFMDTDIRLLKNEKIEMQDFMTLSNLIIYAHEMYPDNPLQGFHGLIKDLSQKLNQNGQIIVGYLYDIENEDDYRDVYHQSLRDLFFGESEYMYHYIKSMNDLDLNRDSENHDACLVYTKK